ncbi:MAG: alpha/beta hydrolase [Anaerolineales bacterium]|jgi:predicted esterase
MSFDVHQGQPILQAGESMERADRLVILLHGRGATAESMLSLSESLQSANTCFWLPQAAGNRWYPNTAFGPLEPNEPDLSSALSLVSNLIDQAAAAGISKESILLGGFSQGACLAAEYLVRNPDRYGGLFVFSGALIGPPGKVRVLIGDLRETPAFLGLGDRDPWVALDVFEEAGRVITDLGGLVDKRIYPGMGHTINQEEIELVRQMIASA